MKTTVLTAALLAAFAMPAFADDAIKTDNTTATAKVDPVTTSSTTRTDMKKVTVKGGGYDGCMRRQTANMM